MSLAARLAHLDQAVPAAKGRWHTCTAYCQSEADEQERVIKQSSSFGPHDHLFMVIIEASTNEVALRNPVQVTVEEG